MKKILRLMMLAICYFITILKVEAQKEFSSNDLQKAATAPATSMVNSISKIILDNSFEERRMRLPFTDSSANYVVQKIGHNYVMDGDIIVDNDYPRTKSYITRDDWSYVWPNAEIPFTIDASIYFNNMEGFIMNAINEINKTTCLRLVPRTNQSDYVNFIGKSPDDMGKAAGSSYIGRRGSDQDIKLRIGANGKSGIDKRTVIHEILHAACVYHEMSRPDRDQYIRIDEDNLSFGQRHWYNYATHSGGYATGAFDYCSVMMYSQKGFAEDATKNVWVPIKDGKEIALPQCSNIKNSDNLEIVLSQNDINGINNFYGNQQPSNIKAPTGSAQRFMVNTNFLSKNLRYKVQYLSNGSLAVIRMRDNMVVWNTPTIGRGTGVVVMQSDGNLVMYENSGEVIWSTNTYNNWDSKLTLENDGNLNIKNSNGQVIWQNGLKDNDVVKHNLLTGNPCFLKIKWNKSVGMPVTGTINDWFKIDINAPTYFEENNYFNTEYNDAQNTYIGHYTDFKNQGVIQYGAVYTQEDYNILPVTITGIPVGCIVSLDVNLNNEIIWTGQTLPITNPLKTIYERSVINETYFAKYKNFFVPIQNSQLTGEVEVQGYYAANKIDVKSTGVKDKITNPGGPIKKDKIKIKSRF
jgi:Astacin (Peptidase family M12A)